MEYIFTLKFQLSDADSDVDLLVGRLAAAGCDDALVGIGLPGRLALEFTREAADAAGAMRSALDDVQRALPSAVLIEAAPDLVGLTDAADLLGVSRQNMRKLMLAHPDSFPAPMHEGSTSLWHLADVLSWWQGRDGFVPDATLAELAAAALQVNLAKEARRLNAASPLLAPVMSLVSSH